MTVLTETIDVARPVSEAFAYVSDFTTTAEWDATAIRAKKMTPGPVGAGTRFEVICAIPGGSVEILYSIVKWQTDEYLELLGKSKFFEVRDQIQFSSSKRGTKIDYSATFAFNLAVKPLAAISHKGLEKMGRESVAGLAVALEDEYAIDQGTSLRRRMGDHLMPGLALFTRLGYKLGKKRFNPMSTSVQGKHMVVTGATAGLGYEVAKELARRDVDLTLVARDHGKAARVVAELKKETGNSNIDFELANLSLLGDVDRLVKSLKKSGKAIDVLVNNAGALFNRHQITSEGLESSLALLLLSPCRLTEGLKPLLKKAAAPRVVNVVSGGMYSQKLDVDALLEDDATQYSGSGAYARQKRALMVLTEEWASQWAEDGIIVNAMHPGWADTPGVQGALPLFRKVTKSVLRTGAEGADTIVWLAVAREAGQVSGRLFLDRDMRSTHLLSSTVESAQERTKLHAFLNQYARGVSKR